MTEVYLYKKGEHYLGFEVSGHAGYAEHGQDIVCAALSMTSISTVNGLQLLLDIVPDVMTDEDTGYLKCSLPKNLNLETTAKADLLLAQFSVAITGLVEAYPNYVTLFTREVLKDD